MRFHGACKDKQFVHTFIKLNCTLVHTYPPPPTKSDCIESDFKVMTTTTHFKWVVVVFPYVPSKTLHILSIWATCVIYVIIHVWPASCPSVCLAWQKLNGRYYKQTFQPGVFHVYHACRHHWTLYHLIPLSVTGWGSQGHLIIKSIRFIFLHTSPLIRMRF